MESDQFDIGPSVLAPGPPKHSDRLARLLVWPLLITLFVTTVVFYVLFSPLRVVGDSMFPSLRPSERVLRTKQYDYPKQYDIVVIDSETASDRDDIIKRVIAVPGDTVEIRDDVAIVNGRVENLDDITLFRSQGFYREALVVPSGYVYVLGDNRPVSLDSRMIGAIPLEKVRGKAVFVFAPVYAIRKL